MDELISIQHQQYYYNNYYN